MSPFLSTVYVQTLLKSNDNEIIRPYYVVHWVNWSNGQLYHLCKGNREMKWVDRKNALSRQETYLHIITMTFQWSSFNTSHVSVGMIKRLPKAVNQLTFNIVIEPPCQNVEKHLTLNKGYPLDGKEVSLCSSTVFINWRQHTFGSWINHPFPSSQSPMNRMFVCSHDSLFVLLLHFDSMVML